MLHWVYHFASFELDPSERTIRRAGEAIVLTPKAFDVLLALVERHGRLVEKDELINCVWPDTFVEETNLTYNISVLRKALGDSAENPEVIETVPKRGYRFVAAVSTVERNSEVSSAGVEPRPEGEIPEAGTGNRRRTMAKWSGIAAAVALLTAGGWMLTNRSAVEFRERDLVLVGEFQNRSGDPLLDGLLETALEVELTRTRYLGVASAERVNDVLRLMRQPPIPRLPAALAREACLRDPAMRAAIVGTIRKVGTGYLLTAEIIRPGDGRIIGSFDQAADDQKGILPAVGRLAAAIRSRLGENLPDSNPAGQAPTQATTNSLPALKLYSDALVKGADNRWAEAETVLRRAVELDPQFASAHLLLAWAIHNQNPSAPSAFMPYAESALALASGTSERESLFINGSYYSLSGQNLKAIPFYELLVRNYPDHPWAANNLLLSYMETSQHARASVFLRQLINVRPNDPAAYLQAVPRCFCPPDPNLQDVRRLADRGVELARQQGRPDAVKSYQLQRAYHLAGVAWAQGDVRRCKGELDEMRRQLPEGDPWTAYAAIGYMALGQLREADQLLERVTDTAFRLRWLTWRALLAGDMKTARQTAIAMRNERANPLTAIAMIRAGDLEGGDGMVKRFNPHIYVDPALIARADLRARQNRVPLTVDGLTEAVRSLKISGLSERWLGARMLAEAHAAQGDLDGAVSVLKETGDTTRACGGLASAVFWPQARHELMLLYRRQKRFQEADAIRSELDKMLSLADANHVIRVALAGK